MDWEEGRDSDSWDKHVKKKTVEGGVDDEAALHSWLRPIKRGQFRFADFAPHLRENVTFTF